MKRLMMTERLHHVPGISIITREDKTFLITSTLKIWKLNRTSFDIWHLCNGKYTLNQMLNKLAIKYGNTMEVREDVLKAIVSMIKARLIYSTTHRMKSYTQLYHEAMKRVVFPSKIWVSVVEDCNYNCPSCNAWKIKRSMSPSDAERIARQLLRRSFVNPVIWITGGEPFMKPNVLFAFIKASREAMRFDEPFFVIETNGTLITRELIDQFRKLLSSSIVTRCMTLREYYDIYVFKRFSFTRFIIDLDPIFFFNDKYIYHQVKRSLRILTKRGFGSYLSVTFTNDPVELVYFLQEMKKKFGEKIFIIKLPRSGKLQSNNLVRLLQLLSALRLNVQFWDDQLYRIHNCASLTVPPPCCAGRVIAVNSRGEVFPCINVINEERYSIGNLKRSTLVKTMKSPNAQRMQRIIMRHLKECFTHCCLAYYCSGCSFTRSLPPQERCRFAKAQLNLLLANLRIPPLE